MTASQRLIMSGKTSTPQRALTRIEAVMFSFTLLIIYG